MASEEAQVTVRENALYKALEKIVEEQGKFDEQESHFMKMSPFFDRRCGLCWFYMGPRPECGAVTRVQGNIMPESLCRLYVIPNLTASEKMRLQQPEKPIEEALAR